MAQFREAVQQHRVVNFSFTGDGFDMFVPKQREVDAINDDVFEAVNAGRVFDFGFLPNSVFMHSSKRGGRLYNQGFLGHPFSEPYVIFHTWDAKAATLAQHPELSRTAEKMGLGPMSTSAYIVQAIDDSDTGCFEAVELCGVEFSGQKVLVISDRITVKRHPEQPDKYDILSSPAAWRLSAMAALGHDPMKIAKEAASNVADPVVTALLILATDGVPRGTVSVSPKLNKARLKNGKLAIPNYEVVKSELYVTAIQARHTPRIRGEDQGGQHASPVMHYRQGHTRTFASGARTWIRDTLVNATPEAIDNFMKSRRRSHYEVRP